MSAGALADAPAAGFVLEKLCAYNGTIPFHLTYFAYSKALRVFGSK